MRIVFGGTSYADMVRSLLLSRVESCALILASPPTSRNRRSGILVREVYPAPDQAYTIRRTNKSQLRPDFLVPIVQRARQEHLSVIFVHTHPRAKETPTFSSIDDEGEAQLKEFLARRVPDGPHASLVVGTDRCAARLLGSGEPLSVIQVGRKVNTLCDPSTPDDPQSLWDRQVRAFGKQGQAAIQKARVAIVGVGGIGSLVALQLAHLGVKDFILVDPDFVDETNLNRLVGSRRSDVGGPKTTVALNLIKGISSDASLTSLTRDVTENEVAERLLDVDAIFGCTDSHASRAILNQLAYQYFIPLFDVGVGIVAKTEQVTHISGRVQMASPGLACLVCAGVIDPNAVRRELQSAAERAADPYISGQNEPQPAVISLNGTMASLAVTMFMSTFTPVPGEARLQYYNGITGEVRPATLRADPTCVVCSRSGALGLGRTWPLPGKATRS